MTNDPTAESDLSDLPLGLLLGRISGALRVDLREACAGAGDDVRLIGLALAIQGNPGASQADYARYLGIDLNTASRLINRAEEQGTLRRVPSAADRRAFVLELTDAGQAIADAGTRAVALIEDRMKAQIGASDFDAFRRTAEQLLQLLA